MTARKIIHIDMDCFYAAIEMRDNPLLKNQPIAVGGDVNRRGVLCTCNYEARDYGVYSAMSTVQALRLCPSLVVLPVNMDKYKQASREIHEVFHQFTDRIEPLSLDEAFLDITGSTEFRGSATYIAQAIRARIYKKTGLTSSAGASVNKCLAKIGSDWHKPAGQKVIPPDEVDIFMEDLAVRKLPGVGKVTEERLTMIGIKTCGQLQAVPLLELTRDFGSYGKRLHELAHGIDDREVVSERLRKSVSVEETFVTDLMSIEGCLNQLPDLQERLTKRLDNLDFEWKIHKQFVKLKFNNFIQTTNECISDNPDSIIFHQLLGEAFQRDSNAVRLIGIGVRFKPVDKFEQLLLFK